nr:MAG TPA: hypothetical protein [Caudoviricetes sp.]
MVIQCAGRVAVPRFESTAWHWVLWHHSWGLASPVGLTTKKALASVRRGMCRP